MPTAADSYRARRGPASCDEVGFRRGGRLDQDVGARFRRAYDAAGGEARLGCPREDDPSGFVGRWGPGWRQDLRGGSEGEARLMAAGRDAPVVVMSGRWHRDYTHGSGFGPNSGPVLGYPVADPASVDGCLVVRLRGGEAGPALMASGPDGTMYWVPGPGARLWLELGGPGGALGRPVGRPDDRGAGTFVQPFERGSVSGVQDGTATTDGVVERPLTEPDEPVRQLLADLNRELYGAVDDPFTVRGWTDVAARLHDAEREIQSGRYADAATDLGTALQLAFRRAGFAQQVLGEQLRAARAAGVFSGLGNRLGGAVEDLIAWISGLRNSHGDAHPTARPASRAEALLGLRLVRAIAGWLADGLGPP